MKLDSKRRSNFLSVKGQVTTIFVAAVCLLSNVRSLNHVSFNSSELFGKDSVTLHEKRFDKVKKILPKNGVIGYVDDSFKEIISQDGWSPEVLLTQYTLSPLIVKPNFRHTYVIGNFNTLPSKDLLAENHLNPISDYENGVVVLSSEKN